MRSIAHTYTRAPFIFSWLPGCKVVNEIYEAFDLFVCWLLCSVVDSFDGVLLALLWNATHFYIECIPFQWTNNTRFAEQIEGTKWENVKRCEKRRNIKIKYTLFASHTVSGEKRKGKMALTQSINRISQMNMRKFAQFSFRVFPVGFWFGFCRWYEYRCAPLILTWFSGWIYFIGNYCTIHAVERVGGGVNGKTLGKIIFNLFGFGKLFTFFTVGKIPGPLTLTL